MIDVIVSDNCQHCESQLDIMRKSFFEDEYRIVKESSEAFISHEYKNNIVGFPYIIVKDDEDGNIMYASVGVHDGTALRKIQRRGSVGAFNLSKAKSG